MKVQKFESHISRKVLTGMVVHDGVLTGICSRLGKERRPFGHKWLDLVAGWCIDYNQRYGKAPRRHIMDRFMRYVDEVGDEDVVHLVEKFLTNLGQDYVAIKKDLNEAYILDLAFQLFSRTRLQQMVDDVQDALEANDMERAHEMHGAYQKFEASVEKFQDPFSKENILETFKKQEATDSLVTFPGALGEFLTPHFKRSDFVAFVGPEKRGKSFWLGEVIWRALRCRRRVLSYSFGDMSQEENNRRLYCRAVRKPWRDTEIHYPRKLLFNEDGTLRRVKADAAEIYAAVRPKDVWRARKHLLQVTASNEIQLRQFTSGGNTVSATAIERKVERLVEREGWMPDVIVIDYADLLEPEPGTAKQETRHQNNLTWMILRRIALKYHCLVVTATQASARSYKERRTLSKQDFSEDKRKNAHVTGMIGINQLGDEKEAGVYRLNWIVLRDGKWSDRQVVWTAGCLGLSMPAVVSSFGYKKIE